MNYCLPYAGKQSGTPNEYYITKTDEYTKYLVNGAIKMPTVSVEETSLDRHFTSIAIADWCQERDITMEGNGRKKINNFTF